MNAIKRIEANLSIPELCREACSSTATFYKWWTKFACIDTSILVRMMALKEES